MKIIKVNDSQEKLKYEIYSMQLKQEQVKKYREEQAEKLKFYSLRFENSYDSSCINGLDLVNCIGHGVGTCNRKYLFEFPEIPISEKSVVYGEGIDTSSTNYLLFPYECSSYSELFKEEIEQGLAQREDFKKQFIEEGLLDYDFFKHIAKTNNPMCAYIFLNSIDFGSLYYSYTDNVVCMPNELIAMYLLEKGYIEDAYYYINKIVDLEEERKLFANFEFEKSFTFSSKQIEDLLDSGILEKEALTRKISNAKYIAKYIK